MKQSAKIAGLIAIVVLVGLMALMRVTNHVPFVLALAAFAIAFVALLPRQRGRKPAAKEQGDPAAAAAHELEDAGQQLASLARAAPAVDEPVFEHMALLMERLARHHRLNPDHARRTARFRKHVVGRIVEVVSTYVELTRRARPDQRERLADISSRIEGFVPVLERIDQACIENDLTALEVNVEVLNEQLDRRGGTGV